MEIRQIDINLLEENTGQIDGLPANPREWTATDLDRLTKSIEETPELLEARGAIVVQNGENYVVLGGNMRLQACRRLGKKEMPCYVLPEGTPAEKLKEIVIKDNGSFGSWDWEELANNWDDLSLVEWGVDVWKGGEASEDSQNSSANVTKAQVKEDSFNEDEDVIKVRCQKGDIWELGNHRLMCGDSIDLEDIKSLMGGY